MISKKYDTIEWLLFSHHLITKSLTELWLCSVSFLRSVRTKLITNITYFKNHAAVSSINPQSNSSDFMKDCAATQNPKSVIE